MIHNRSGFVVVRVVSVLAALVLVASGCGNDDDGRASPGDDRSNELDRDGGDGEAPFPVTIEHRFGSTIIDAEPERVAVVGLVEQDALLALGVVPVATTEWFGDFDGAIFPWAQGALDELGGPTPAILGDAAAINFEAVAAQRPDLIVALYSGLEESDYERLSQIAPTIAQPGGYVDYGVPWDELTVTVGSAIGKRAAAERLVADVDALFDRAQEDHPDFVGASGVVATPYEGIFLYSPEDARGRLLTALGFALPSDIVAVTGEEFGGQLSLERADYLDLDVVVWLDYSSDQVIAPYEALAVHTEGREVHLSSFSDPLGAATSYVTVLSLPYLLDELVPRLALAIDGDPTTEVPR